MALPVSLKMGLGNNCHMLNVCDVVSRARRINRPNKLTRWTETLAVFSVSKLCDLIRQVLLLELCGLPEELMRCKATSFVLCYDFKQHRGYKQLILI